MTDHHGLHHITSHELKGDDEINIKFQHDLSKINYAHNVCIFLFRLHSDLQKIVYEHQGIDKVATDIVPKLRTNNESYFPKK